MPANLDPGEAPDRREWDAIVIGTGMGGATLGYALARAGLSVLFLEKGRSHLSGASALCDDYAEAFFSRQESPEGVLARAGRTAEELTDLSDGQPRRFVPFMGCGTGGSSALYGMAMERLFPEDFTPRRYHSDPATTLPESWPITFADLAPHYEAAEGLFRVRGEQDPLRGAAGPGHLLPSPPLHPANQELADFLYARQLHPYRLPMACEYERGNDRSQGFLDGRGRKNDAAQICLRPALARHGASLLDECTVLRLEAGHNAVEAVHCWWRGRYWRLRGRVIVLAAGALATSALLLNSATPRWPKGLANRTGLVGANLMRHFIDLYLLDQGRAVSDHGNIKQLGLSDLYLVDGAKLGSVQSFGPMPPAALAVANLESDLRLERRWLASELFRLAKPLVRRLVQRWFARSLALAAILEDLPYRDNRVFLHGPIDAHGIRRGAICYHIQPHDRGRIAESRRRLTALLRPRRFLCIKQAESNRPLAHVCGTCRFGADPKASVLDPTNRAHGLPNLYVVDASFFPSSGGVNPGLTVAANALRVAHGITGANVSGNTLAVGAGS